MKKLETLAKSLVNADFASIINNEDVVVDSLTENEKFAVLIFAELEKALKTKEYFLTLDCNYKQSKNEVLKVDYFRLVSNDTQNQSMIQFYCRANAKKATCKFLLCTSCAKANREQFESLENELHFTVKRDKKTNRAKTTQRNDIDYAEIVDVVKAVCAVLANKKTEQ